MIRFIRYIAYSLTIFAAASAQAARPIDEPVVTPVAAVLSVIDPATGRSRDLVNAERQSFGNPVVLGDTVFVGNSAHVLYAFDGHNGKIKWRFAADGPLFGLIATEKMVFSGAGGTLNALDPTTGNSLWKYESDLPVTDPVLVDDAIVFNALDGPIALEQATGKLRWQLAVQWGHFVFSPLNDHRLCVWKPDEIFVIETERGKVLWQNTPDQSVTAPGALPTAAVATGDAIFQLRGSATNAEDWSLRAMDAGSGRELWKTPLGQHESAGARTTITGDCIYTQLEDQISAIDMHDGTIKWQATVEHLEAGGVPPMVDHGMVIVPQLGGDITALDEKTGKPKWTNAAPKPSADGQMHIGGMCVSEAGVFVTRNEQTRR